MADFWTDAQTSSANLRDVASNIFPTDLNFGWDMYATAGSFAALGDEAIKAQIELLTQKFIGTLRNPATAERLATDLARVASSGVAGLEQFPNSSIARTVVQDVLKGLSQSCSELSQQIQRATANSGFIEPTWKNLADVEGGAVQLAKNLANVMGGLVAVTQIIDTAISTGNPDAVGEKTLGAIAGIAGGGVVGAVVMSLVGVAGLTVSAPVVLTAALVGAAGGYLGGQVGEWVYRNSPFLRAAVDELGSAGSWWGDFFFLYENGTGSITDRLSNAFTAAQRWLQPRRSPITLDLNDNGLETVGLNSANPILFDHTGSGIKTSTGWVAPSDGFLVLDRNNNGSIDNGTELFGDSTPLYDADGNLTGQAADGFAALAQQDTNADGLVDALDAHFADLRIWQDLNQDGLTQEGELKTLAEHHIASLTVADIEHSRLLPNRTRINGVRLD